MLIKLYFSQMRVVYCSRLGSKLGELETNYTNQVEEAITLRVAYGSQLIWEFSEDDWEARV